FPLNSTMNFFGSDWKWSSVRGMHGKRSLIANFATTFYYTVIIGRTNYRRSDTFLILHHIFFSAQKASFQLFS
ncbi:MAG: hypothetical protein ACTSVY_04275, partial [Candidatus Helarchaeota archaeon]